MIYFPNQLLSPIEDLLLFSEITPESIADAILEWENNPPDIDFKSILQAESEEDNEEV